MPLRIQEGFPNQRLVVVPANVGRRCDSLPLVRHLHVTDIGSYPAAPGHYVERQPGVSQAILIYCLSGLGQLRLRGEPMTIERGTLCLIPPDVPHTYNADDADPWSLFWIHFRGGHTQDVLASLGVTEQQPLLYVPDVQRMRASFEAVYACLNYHYSDAGLLAMSAQLLRFIGDVKLHRVQSKSVPGSQQAEDGVVATVDFMQEHLDLPLSLDDLARRAGQSVSQYSKLFKERTGQSAMAYFAQLKVRKACELLDETTMSVKEIAGELGYQDPYYFSRLFKKIQGCAPTAYREAVKG